MPSRLRQVEFQRECVGADEWKGSKPGASELLMKGFIFRPIFHRLR